MSADSQAEKAVSVGIDRLLGEIDRAVALIDQLRGDNAALKQEMATLESRLAAQTQETDSLRADRDRLQRVYDDNASLIEHKGEIQSKIDQMLSRLDGVHAS
ncbi:MAG: hypothetical protein CME26_00940 [Gemmatimonadetes bacterium]|nr:hypothetical protein [Gemmatimonadota bacterium]|tara:strand:- start:3683 stop:3988 length:306 start_codon:yes stop_codon:yes gene_type:complete